ncbi:MULTISPECIES: LCP family protein [unclassified Synechocystis]|nr:MULTISPECIES: LCP family protein [unclassified Synechocystis]UOO10181.1 LCP family protein [Synechocystis sp. PCC 6803]
MAKNSNKRGGDSHNGKKSPRKGKFQGGKWLLTGFALTAIALVSAGAGSLLAMYSTPLGQSELTPEQAAVFGQEKAVSYKNLNIPQLSRPINVLLLGTKVLTSEEPDPSQPNPGYHALVNSVEGLTDTMVLIRLDPKEKSLVVLSIPRDTRVEIPGYSGARKINQANALGGPALAAMTVTDLLGDVPIDRYIRVNVQAVEKLIDALGGVDVYVPRDMKYQDDSQRLYINLKEGQQRLDGEKALQMLRFRYDALGDIGRIQRQQIVMRAVVEQALKPQTILRIPDIVKILQSNIDTNLNMEELVAIAGFSAQIPREDVKMLMLPGDFNGTGRTSISYWLPHQPKIQAMTEEYFGAMATNSWLWDMDEDLTALDPYGLRIAIQDSTDRPQAVKALVKELETAGYSRINVVSAFSPPLQTTRVIAQQGDHLGARQVRNSIGLGEVLVDSNGYLISDVTIQIGADWP